MSLLHDLTVLLGIPFAISSLPSIGADRRSGAAGIDGVGCDPLKRTARPSARRARAATARRERAAQVTLICSWVTDGASQTPAPARRTTPLFERCCPDPPCPPRRRHWVVDRGILSAMAAADRRHAQPSLIAAPLSSTANQERAARPHCRASAAARVGAPRPADAGPPPALSMLSTAIEPAAEATARVA